MRPHSVPFLTSLTSSLNLLRESSSPSKITISSLRTLTGLFRKTFPSMIIEGNVLRNKPVRVLRDEIVIFEGELDSLRRFKEDVNEVKNGTECGRTRFHF